MTRVQSHPPDPIPVGSPVEPGPLAPAFVDPSGRIVGEPGEDRDLVTVLRQSPRDVLSDGSLLWGEPLGQHNGSHGIVPPIGLNLAGGSTRCRLVGCYGHETSCPESAASRRECETLWWRESG